MTVTLTDLTERAEEAIAKRDAEVARQAEVRARTDLRDDRTRAVRVAKERLDLDTDPNAWERLPAADGFTSRSVYLAVDDDPTLALIFRQAAYTQGGDLLTVGAYAEERGDLVSGGWNIGNLLDLPRAIEEARAAAAAFDDPDYDADDEPVELAPTPPPFTLTNARGGSVGFTDPGELLVYVLRALVVGWTTPEA